MTRFLAESNLKNTVFYSRLTRFLIKSTSFSVIPGESLKDRTFLSEPTLKISVSVLIFFSSNKLSN